MIELQHVGKQFGDQVVLDDVSCAIGEGEVWCVIGQSGGGKSVMMKLMTGLLKPETGKILIDGEDTTKFSAKDWDRVLKQVGVVFQGAALFSSVSIFENVGLRLLEERKMPVQEIKEKVKAALVAVGLDPAEVMQKFPGELSGGMQKRVGVARAIVHEPKLLFFDEPTTGLDPLSSGKIDGLIHGLAQVPGRTSIIITHDIFMAKMVATKVLLLHDHKVHFMGSPEQLFNSPDAVVQQFLSRRF